MYGWSTDMYHGYFKPSHDLAGDTTCRRFALLDIAQLCIGERYTDIGKLAHGEVLLSVRFLQNRWGWGAGKVVRFLTYLRNTKRNTTRNTSGGVLTVIKKTDHGTLYLVDLQAVSDVSGIDIERAPSLPSKEHSGTPTGTPNGANRNPKGFLLRGHPLGGGPEDKTKTENPDPPQSWSKLIESI
jgi:hypothetical protein